MNITSIYSILDGFAKRGLVFSNEQDFQFEFAKALSEEKDIVDVKLEVLSLSIKWDEVENIAKKKGKISRDKKEYTDIIVKTTSGEYVAVELKYKTPDKICCYDTLNGKTITMVQGAYDFNAYDYILDISRLENLKMRHFCNDISITKGYAILLTNYNQYRFNDFSESKIWRSYAINDGHTISRGDLLFKENEKEYSTKGRRFTSISLRNSYKLCWKDYCLEGYRDIEDSKKSCHPGFSYVVVEVKP